MPTADPASIDTFYISQLIRPMINRYEVSTLGPDEKSAGDAVCFVEQKRMKLKEDIRAYTDDTKTSTVMAIKAQQRFDPRAKFTIADGEGQKIGGLKKVFGKSLLRSTWEIFDEHDQQVAWAQESSLGVALWRRFSNAVPYIGDLLGLIPIPYHFDFHPGVTGDDAQRIGRMTRIIAIRDRYALDFSADTEKVLDRRVGLALAIGLDALQAR